MNLMMMMVFGRKHRKSKYGNPPDVRQRKITDVYAYIVYRKMPQMKICVVDL